MSKPLCYETVKGSLPDRNPLAAMFVFLLSFVLLPVWAHGAGSISPLEVDASSHDSNVALVSGQELRIRLTENPSTGYTWSVLRQDPKKLELVRKTFLPPDKNIPGAPGKALFVFKAIGTGSTALELAYFRSWEGKQNAAERFQLAIAIK